MNLHIYFTASFGSSTIFALDDRLNILAADEYDIKLYQSVSSPTLPFEFAGHY